MKLRDPRDIGKAEIMIIPMIDIMFFLLVFFMLSTMYMVNLKTINVKLPQAAHAAAENTAPVAITLREDGSIYIDDSVTDMKNLLIQIKAEKLNNENLAVIIRADKNVDYGKVIEVIDNLKGCGVSKFGMATNNGV